MRIFSGLAFIGAYEHIKAGSLLIFCPEAAVPFAVAATTSAAVPAFWVLGIPISRLFEAPLETTTLEELAPCRVSVLWAQLAERFKGGQTGPPRHWQPKIAQPAVQCALPMVCILKMYATPQMSSRSQ
jgi:hypothetical protein